MLLYIDLFDFNKYILNIPISWMQWIIIMIYYESKPCWKTLLSPQILFCHLEPFVFFPIVDDFFKKRDSEFLNCTQESNESRV